MNQIYLSGKAQKVVKRQILSGKEILHFTLVQKDVSVNNKPFTQYFDVEQWSPRINLSENDDVMVVGKLKKNSYTNKQGQQVNKTIVSAFQIYHVQNFEDEFKLPNDLDFQSEELPF